MNRTLVRYNGVAGRCANSPGLGHPRLDGGNVTHPTCAIEGCEKKTEAHGWCHTHYIRWYRHGDPTFTLAPGGTCTVEGCDRKRDARKLCRTHYGRLMRSGTTDAPTKPSVQDRFWSKVDVGHPLGCWTWNAALTNGYGSFGAIHGQPSVLAHRFAYEALVGPIPDGLGLDHLCRNTVCVNPDHLEAVTHMTNVRRGAAPSARKYRARRRVRTLA